MIYSVFPHRSQLIGKGESHEENIEALAPFLESMRTNLQRINTLLWKCIKSYDVVNPTFANRYLDATNMTYLQYLCRKYRFYRNYHFSFFFLFTNDKYRVLKSLFNVLNNFIQLQKRCPCHLCCLLVFIPIYDFVQLMLKYDIVVPSFVSCIALPYSR